VKALLKKIGLKGMKSTVGNGKPALEHSYKMESLRSDTLIFVLHLLGAFIVKANQAAALSNAIIQAKFVFASNGLRCFSVPPRPS